MSMIAAVVESAMDAVISIDGTQRVVQFNPAAERLFGISQADAIGQPLSRFIPERFRRAHERHVESFADTGRTQRSPGHLGAVTALRADGSEFLAEATISRTFVAGSQILSVIVRDASQRQTIEAQAQRARTMDAVAQLAAGVAHDFNNLLMVILGNLELIEMSNGDPSTMKEFAREARGAAERGTALARQLLTFSRKSPPPRHPVDVAAAVANHVKSLKRTLGERRNLTIEVSPGSYTVDCDGTQLEQVLTNLVSNARDAMPDGGTVSIGVDAKGVALDDPRWRSLPPARYVRLVVKDTGLGMTEEARRRAFEPFFSTKPAGHGTGLGLAAVFGIVNQLGGAIDVESAPRAGSTFTILLPFSDRPLSKMVSGDTPTVRRGHGVILLVDDEPSVRATLRMILSKNGYTVVEASNGPDALAAYLERDGRVDLLLTDLRMPGMDGRDLVNRLRSERPGLPVLLMSGYDDRDSGVGEADESGDVVLQKPFSAPDLLSAIGARLGP